MALDDSLDDGEAETGAFPLGLGGEEGLEDLALDVGGHSLAVVDDAGVVGQVTRAYPSVSEVTLLTEKDHTVPVKIEHSGLRTLLVGAGTGRAPELRFMSASADVQSGDVLVTSSIDGTYPPGLAVAVVAAVERDSGRMFARITCRPLAGVDRSEQLLIIPSPTAGGPAQSGEEVSMTVDLQAGTYKIWCPVRDHEARGMVTEITLT